MSWDKFAKENPFYYVLTNQASQDPEHFFRSGKEVCDSIVNELETLGVFPEQSTLLEVGCGVGRMTKWLAQRFYKVVATDLSEEMIKLARQYVQADNVNFLHTPESDLKGLANQSIDVAVSYLVFQHIESTHIISRYVKEIHRILKVGGTAWLQFDTRPLSLIHRLYLRVPAFLDRLLPKHRRKGVRRYPKRSEWLRSEIKMNKFSIISERGENSHMHIFLLRKV